MKNLGTLARQSGDGVGIYSFSPDVEILDAEALHVAILLVLYLTYTRRPSF